MTENPNDILDKIIAGNKAKADKKKAKKPTKVDAMRARKIKPKPGETPEETLKRATDEGWEKLAPHKDTKKSKTSPENTLNSGDIGAYPLKDKMEMFCQYYIGEAKLNATQAAIKAGYSQKTAQRIGSENLSKPVIRDRIAYLQRATMQKLDVTPERIMAEVAKIAFANLGNFIKVQADGTGYIDLKDVTPDMFAALEQYEVTELPPFKTVENGEEVVREVLKIKVKLNNKLDALEKLMRRHNLVKPIEVNHNHTGKVTYELPDLARRMAFMLAKAAKMANNTGKGVKHGADHLKGSESGGPAV